jgi:hypothetical protein
MKVFRLPCRHHQTCTLTESRRPGRVDYCHVSVSQRLSAYPSMQVATISNPHLLRSYTHTSNILCCRSHCGLCWKGVLLPLSSIIQRFPTLSTSGQKSPTRTPSRIVWYFNTDSISYITEVVSTDPHGKLRPFTGFHCPV